MTPSSLAKLLLVFHLIAGPQYIERDRIGSSSCDMCLFFLGTCVASYTGKLSIINTCSLLDLSDCLHSIHKWSRIVSICHFLFLTPDLKQSLSRLLEYSALTPLPLQKLLHYFETTLSLADLLIGLRPYEISPISFLLRRIQDGRNLKGYSENGKSF